MSTLAVTTVERDDWKEADVNLPGRGRVNDCLDSSQECTPGLLPVGNSANSGPGLDWTMPGVLVSPSSLDDFDETLVQRGSAGYVGSLYGVGQVNMRGCTKCAKTSNY